ncbi:MAG: hypothetical protein ACYSTS_08425 [Planctomycetota bacterium]|jgi:hypothetical protein
MKKDWMAQLSFHYEKMRQLYPEEELAILFDIDGTILDMRYMILNVLKTYDSEHNTRFFQELSVTDINVHENQVDCLLRKLQVPFQLHTEIIDWFNKNRWASKYILQSHHPFSGVLEVIRWFQLQPNTFVGLNTGRPESLRNDTLMSLNKLGKEFKVQFASDLLFMNQLGWEQEVENSKVEGVKYFQERGLKIFAFVDNEPDNLKAVSKIDPDKEILLLHANTIFESKMTRLPSHTVKGKVYDLTELIFERSLPKHIQFVWHGINDEANLRQFLASDINWGECDVRLNPIDEEPILCHDSFKNSPLDADESCLTLDRLLERASKTGKSIKVDLKTGGVIVDKVMESIDTHSLDDSRLWFNSNVERLQELGFWKLSKKYPKAILQANVDFLAPLICSVPDKAREILDMFTEWGINRFSISWQSQNLRSFFEQMNEWGFEVNIYNVPDLESFLQTVLLMPQSITSNFNFPKWYYYGRGSGENGGHYEYSAYYQYQDNEKKKHKGLRRVSAR